jgi:hypothetical protein
VTLDRSLALPFRNDARLAIGPRVATMQAGPTLMP